MSEETIRKGFSGPAMLGAFFAGAVAGVITALLAAPRSGAETRKRIGELTRKPKEVARRIPAALHEARLAARETMAEKRLEVPAHVEAH